MGTINTEFRFVWLNRMIQILYNKATFNQAWIEILYNEFYHYNHVPNEVLN